MDNYQPSTILPPMQGTSKFGGTQSRIIMGGVNCQKLGANLLPGLLINGEQFGLVVDNDTAVKNATANADLFAIENAWSLMSDDAVLNSAIAVVDYDRETLAYDAESGVLSGVTTVAFEAGTAYWCKEIVSIGDVQMYVYEPTVAGRDIREVYEIISAIAPDVAVGKSQLAAAISEKGVPTTTKDSLEGMATKVRQIPQELNTGLSDFDQMIAPSPYIWNVYSVAEDLMKDTFPAYIPAYMAQYKQQYGANSFFVGEYYLGYDTLELTGADGYLTCDGDFYTISGEAGSRIVTHTFPDGTVETYASESIIHTWHDSESGRCNRWVAFLYFANAYSFTNITSSICPRRVALCGECTSFIVSGENRLTDIWVIGTLGHFEGGTTGNTWSSAQVINNYKQHMSGVIYKNAGGSILSILMPELEILSGNIINQTGEGAGLVNIIYLPKLKECTSSGAVLKSEKYYMFPYVVAILLPSLEIANGCILSIGTSGYSTSSFKLRSIYTPNLRVLYNDNSYGNGIIRSANFSQFATLPDLIDFEVGALETSLYCKFWNPTNVLADADKKAQLIDNIKNHILTRVSDRTGLSQLVFTVSTNMYNAIASEQIEWQGGTMSLADVFLTKNWLLAGA